MSYLDNQLKSFSVMMPVILARSNSKKILSSMFSPFLPYRYKLDCGVYMALCMRYCNACIQLSVKGFSGSPFILSKFVVEYFCKRRCYLYMDKCLNISYIKTIISNLGDKYGADRVYLFGSYARGDATEESDVDLRLDRGRIRGLSMGSFLLDAEEALGKRVDLLSTKCLDEEFLASIKNEEILLYERQGL